VQRDNKKKGYLKIFKEVKMRTLDVLDLLEIEWELYKSRIEQPYDIFRKHARENKISIAELLESYASRMNYPAKVC
jgi:hypothetical protein